MNHSHIDIYTQPYTHTHTQNTDRRTEVDFDQQKLIDKSSAVSKVGCESAFKLTGEYKEFKKNKRQRKNGHQKLKMIIQRNKQRNELD